MVLSVNHGDTKSLDLFDSEETPPPTKKGNSMTKSSRSPKAAAATKKKQCDFFFDGMRLLLYLLLQLLSLMAGFTATGIEVTIYLRLNNASASTMRLMLHHCWLWYWQQFPPWQWRKQCRGQHQIIKRVWLTLMLSIVSYHTFDQNWRCVYVGPGFF